MARYETRVAYIRADYTTYWLLSRMCHSATKIYNTAMWHSKKIWEETGKIPSGYDLEKIVKDSYWHKQIPASCSCLMAQIVGRSYKSWFELRKQDDTAQPPSFKPKNNLSPLGYRHGTYSYTSQDNLNFTIEMSLGSELKRELNYPRKRLSLNLRWNVPIPVNGEIVLIEINPSNTNPDLIDHFEIHAKVELPPVPQVHGNNFMFVDIGVINPIVSMTKDGRVDIFKGSEILSNLRYWNKTISKISERLMKESNKKYSKKLSWAHKKRSRQIIQKVHAMVSAFVDVCIAENVSEVIVGDLTGIKKEEDGTGKKWRRGPSNKDKSKMDPDQNVGSSKEMQKVMQFPMARVISIMEYKLLRHGIKMSKIDESWTTKGRCFVCGQEYTTDKAWIKRGLFRCINCHNDINADVNAAGNIRARYLDTTNLSGVLGEGVSIYEANVWHWNRQSNEWRIVHSARGQVTYKKPSPSRHISSPVSQQGISSNSNKLGSSSGITPLVE